MKIKSVIKNIFISALVVASIICATGILYTKEVKAAETGGFATATGSNRSGVVVRNLVELERAFAERKHHIIIAGTINQML